MNISRHNMFKWSAMSVAALVAATTVCNAEPIQEKAEVNKNEIHYSCVTSKNEKFDVVVLKKKNSYGVIVDGKDEIVVENMNVSSAFYSIIQEDATSVVDGKEYYTMGLPSNLSTCTKK